MRGREGLILSLAQAFVSGAAPAEQIRPEVRKVFAPRLGRTGR
jgi:hypothetical protein